jgi:hypothetical protein
VLPHGTDVCAASHKSPIRLQNPRVCASLAY